MTIALVQAGAVAVACGNRARSRSIRFTWVARHGAQRLTGVPDSNNHDHAQALQPMKTP